MSSSNVDVSIIIVNWNVREALQANLARLFAMASNVTFEVIVVDNASSDGSADMVRATFPQVFLIENDWNAGFAYACNQGLRVAQGAHLLLLNPDMLLQEGALDALVERLQADRMIGVLGGRLEGEEGPVMSVRRDPGMADQLAIITKYAHLRPEVLDSYLWTTFDYETEQTVQQVRGSLFAFRRDVLDAVGPFDERYFLWYEEVDYCRRVREAGYDVRYCPSVQATDFVGQSFAQVNTVTKQRILGTSLARYMHKWHGRGAGMLFHLLRPYAIVTGAVHDLVTRR